MQILIFIHSFKFSMYRSIVQTKTDADNVKPAGLHDVEAQADLQVPIVLRVLHVKLEAATRRHEPWKGKQEQKYRL